MSLLWQILLFSLVGSVLSLVGGVALVARKKRFTHSQSLLLVSFAAGVLLATAFFDLMPEAMWQMGEVGGWGEILEWTLGGIVFMFLFEKSLLWYHHHHDEEHGEHGGRKTTPEMLMAGDSVHNFIDGMVMAGAFLASPAVGMVTSLAVAAHEIPHEMADFGVLLSKGWSKRRTIVVNVVSAMVAVGGALLVYWQRWVVGGWLPQLLGFAAGSFVYLACSDLIPELHHDHKEEVKNGVWQVVMFGMGMGVVWWLIKLLGE